MGKITVELITPTKCEILSPVSLQLCSRSTEKKDIITYVHPIEEKSSLIYFSPSFFCSIKALAGPLVLGDKQEVDGNNMAVFDQMK